MKRMDCASGDTGDTRLQLACKNMAFATEVPPVDPGAVLNTDPSPSEDHPDPQMAKDLRLRQATVPYRNQAWPAHRHLYQPPRKEEAASGRVRRAPGQLLELCAFTVGVYE